MIFDNFDDPHYITASAMPEPPIETIGTILSALPHNVFQVELKNGKLVIGHLPRRLADLGSSLSPKTRVHLEMTPFDFEKARIAGIVEENEE